MILCHVPSHQTSLHTFLPKFGRWSGSDWLIQCLEVVMSRSHTRTHTRSHIGRRGPNLPPHTSSVHTRPTMVRSHPPRVHGAAGTATNNNDDFTCGQSSLDSVFSIKLGFHVLHQRLATLMPSPPPSSLELTLTSSSSPDVEESSLDSWAAGSPAGWAGG